MEQELTPEQKAHLETWAGKRDLLLSETSRLQVLKDKLEGAVKAASDSYTDIQINFNQVLGRIAELNKKESELPLLISKEIAGLQSQKSVLESEIPNLTKLVSVLFEKKASLEKDVSLAIKTLESMNDRVIYLEKIVGESTEINRNNISMIGELASIAKKGLQDVIELNNEIVNKTNSVIKELPGVFLEVKRQSLEREIIKKQK